jgi:hypothetical protein
MRSASGSRRLARNVDGGKVHILAIPPPYRAWLTISSDPDNTVLRDWRELHSYIWDELALPFGDALFVRSHNCNLPGQVNLHDNPEIADGHYHDTLHGWGDYVHARTRGFDREDAVAAISLLHSHNLTPRVWVDHSTHPQNMLHNSKGGSTPEHVDGSGHVYKSFTYTLDLAAELGIRYLWDGRLTSILGQDTPISPRAWYSRGKSSAALTSFLLLWHWLSRVDFMPWGRSLVTYDVNVNRQYYAHEFADGRTLYCFRRYGTWRDADIDGLAKLISPRNIDDLLSRQGTCIVYSHLGKRRAARNEDELHIPPETRATLKNLQRKYEEKILRLTPVSTLLDYLVIRDNIAISPNGDYLDFRPDLIRFPKLELSDLAGHDFGFRIDDDNCAGKLEIRVSGHTIDATLRKQEDRYYMVSFQK